MVTYLKTFWLRVVGQGTLESVGNHPGIEYIVAYLAIFNCWNQLVIDAHSYLIYRYLFLCVLMCIYGSRQRSFVETLQSVFGKSVFLFNKVCLLDLATLLAACILCRLVLVFLQLHYFPDSTVKFDYIDDCLVAPLSEDPVFFGFMMNSLTAHFRNKLLPSFLLISIIWISFHSLTSVLSLFVSLLALINAICFQRFRSVPCCIAVHSLWNLIGLLAFEYFRSVGARNFL